VQRDMGVDGGRTGEDEVNEVVGEVRARVSRYLAAYICPAPGL